MTAQEAPYSRYSWAIGISCTPSLHSAELKKAEHTVCKSVFSLDQHWPLTVEFDSKYYQQHYRYHTDKQQTAQTFIDRSLKYTANCPRSVVHPVSRNRKTECNF